MSVFGTFNLREIARFEILTVVSKYHCSGMRPSSSVDKYQGFGGTLCLQLQSRITSTFKMDGGVPPKLSTQITRMNV
jgi:hypothetical protein